jgi:hypothetical protein
MPTPVRRLFLLAGKQMPAASAYGCIGSSDNERFLYPSTPCPPACKDCKIRPRHYLPEERSNRNQRGYGLNAGKNLANCYPKTSKHDSPHLAVLKGCHISSTTEALASARMAQTITKELICAILQGVSKIASRTSEHDSPARMRRFREKI